MIMGIMTRFTRICKSDLHGVMDRIEDKGLILKQCLREMEASIAQKQAQLSKMNASRQQVEDELRKYRHEQEKIEQDIQAALVKDRDSIARLLIRKLKTMERHMNALKAHGNSLERRIEAAKESLDNQRQEYERLQLRSETYLQRTEARAWEETISRAAPEDVYYGIADEEIELELIKRKEGLKGGA
jgi:phage shock protein A